MTNIAILPRALGTLFFYSPETDLVKQLHSDLPALIELYDWQKKAEAEALLNNMQAQLDTATSYSFSVLFEGQGEMSAPPWGSVYQNKENLVMDDSTATYYVFLDRVGIELEIERQPLDHLGLMLWVLASLMEDGDQVAIVELLSTHLLTWAYRYLELLKANPQSAFYADLAGLTELFLTQIQSEMDLVVQPIKLYK